MYGRQLGKWQLDLKTKRLPGRICTPITGCFHDKTKISKKNLQKDYYLLQIIARGNAPYFLMSRPNKSLTIKIPQQIAKFLMCFGFKLQVKGGLNNLIFSIGFQMLKSSSFKWL